MPKRKKRMTKAEKELLAANARIGGYEAKFRRQEAVIDPETFFDLVSWHG